MNKRYYINSAVVVALMALFRFIPPFGSMTAMGMTILGIFLGALWGWINCDMIWPSVLALVLLGFSGYTANVTEALTMTISNGTVQLILWLLSFPLCSQPPGCPSISSTVWSILNSAKAILGVCPCLSAFQRGSAQRSALVLPQS